MTFSFDEKLSAAQAFIEARHSVEPETIGVVLGSGLGNFASEISVHHTFQASEIPHYPASTVAGHDGLLMFGKLELQPLVLVKGRVHLYEGRPAGQITFYVRLLARLGVRTLILTNAAGGINSDFHAGDLCVITDHLNLMFEPVSLHPTPHHQPVLYDEPLIDVLLQTASDCDVPLHRGVYAGVKGPSYETPAEVRMLGMMGADLVGMSTVIEASVAASLGMRVLGVSLVTNKAAGLSDELLSHDDVQSVAAQAQQKFSRLLKAFIARV
ncbi:MAG: purine-nucleoside phosphorylase [Rhizobacter sp.]|nr:purine-nucleoside phosphorylase [Chlorobiales bacterium]